MATLIVVVWTLGSAMGKGILRSLGRIVVGLAAAWVLGMTGGCLSTAQREAADAQHRQLADAPYADKILVKKSEHKLYLLKNGQPIRTYSVSLGINPKGHKEYQGDNRTPEGIYFVDGRNAGSKFYKALHISYPNAKDRLDAARRGMPPGGQIMIHGQPARGPHQDLQGIIQGADWTAGCIAVTNPDIDEIWRYTPSGTPIEIRP
jgi:murein L,D-transpeptidase YafK